MLAIIYSEDFMTQFLYQCIPPMLELTIGKEKEDIPVAEKICISFELLGRFCDFKSYMPIIKSSLLVINKTFQLFLIRSFQLNKIYNRVNIQKIKSTLDAH